MRSATRILLHFGPYKTPRFRLGQKVLCEACGEVTIVGISAGRIPWPIGKTKRAKSLVLFRDLVKAVKQECPIAVRHWWGLGSSTVSKWRRILAVPLSNDGTHRLRAKYAREPWAKNARRKAWAKAGDPVRRGKIAAARRGKPRPKHVMAALLRANIGRKPSAEELQKRSDAHRRRGTRPPAAGVPWTPKEDQLLRKLPAVAAAARTGRTLAAVYARRADLKLPDGRRNWTPEEDRLIRGLSVSAAVASTGRSLASVYLRRYRLKLVDKSPS